MSNTRLVAYALIAIGVVALLSRLTADAGWLWIGLVAVAFLAAYQRQRLYAFLVLGSVLMGVAVGILLEGSWHWPGTFLVSLGAGVAAIDLAEPRPNRWPRIVGLALIALGLVTGLAEAGVLTSSAFAVLLIASGVALVVLPGRAPAPAVTPEAPGPEPTPGDRPPAPEGGSRPAAAPPGSRAVDAGDGPDELRAALLAWRSDTARREGRSEALVLRDATIDALVSSRPTSLEQLAAVHGIGPVTLERYGSALLQRLLHR